MGFFTNSGKLEKLEKRLEHLEKENEMLKEAMTDIGKNLIAVDGMIKIVMAAQQQVSFDVSTIYDALQQIIGTTQRGAVDPLDEYLNKMNPFGSDDDDGGLLN
tara:strand:+ start:255 stop:563 length:309 start_codon:yes stop_codon:yes gene_type:complete